MPRGDCLQEWDVHSEQVNCFAALGDGTIVLGCGHVIKHWDPINALCIRTIEDAHGIGQAGCIYSLLKLTDGRVLSVSFGMKTWDIVTGICTRSWEGRTGDGLAALQLRDGRVATGCGDSMITLWDVSIESPLQGPLKRLRGHTGPVYALAQLHGDHLASGSWDATIRVWDISDYAIAGAECTALLRGHSGFVWCLAVLSGGIILASGSNDGTIRLWNTLKGECLKVLTGHTRAVYCLEVLSDGITIVSGSMDNTIRVWGDEGFQRLQASAVTDSGRNDPESGAV
jgi:WD40 repeat protein